MLLLPKNLTSFDVSLFAQIPLALIESSFQNGSVANIIDSRQWRKAFRRHFKFISSPSKSKKRRKKTVSTSVGAKSTLDLTVLFSCHEALLSSCKPPVYYVLFGRTTWFEGEIWRAMGLTLKAPFTRSYFIHRQQKQESVENWRKSEQFKHDFILNLNLEQLFFLSRSHHQRSKSTKLIMAARRIKLISLNFILHFLWTQGRSILQTFFEWMLPFARKVEWSPSVEGEAFSQERPSLLKARSYH